MNARELYVHHRHKKDADILVRLAWESYAKIRKLPDNDYALNDWELSIDGTVVTIRYVGLDEGVVVGHLSFTLPANIFIGHPADTRFYLLEQYKKELAEQKRQQAEYLAEQRAKTQSALADRRAREAVIEADPDWKELRRLQRKLDRKYPRLS